MPTVWDAEPRSDDAGPLMDLGEIGHHHEVPPDGSWGGWRWSELRRFRPAVPVIAVLFLVAAASPAAATLRPAASVPVGFDASVMIEGQTLFVYGIAAGHSGISAYGLADGRPRWSAPASELATETTMSYLDGRVVVSMADTDGNGEHTVVFDARTGTRQWSSELGFASVVAGGVLVESAPPPPGYNFPGTTASTSFQLLDVRTGAIRWSVGVPPGCVTDLAQPAVGAATALLELCASPARLADVDLVDGRTVASRAVDLGDPGRNFTLPPPDRLDEPLLYVMAGTVVVGHADAPTPTIDAYAVGSLRPLWAGLPLGAGQYVAQCGDAMCLFDGGSNGSLVDLATGARIGPIPPGRAELADGGALGLVPVGRHAATVPVLASVAAGVSLLVPTAADPGRSADPGRPPTGSGSWLVVPHVAVPVDQVPPTLVVAGPEAPSCVVVADYLACRTGGNRLALWALR